MRVMSAYNLFVGTAVAVWMDLFDQYAAVLASFLVLNLIDWITGTCKARFLKTESSVDGLYGILKKLGYWIIIFVAFIIGQDMAIMGSELGFEFGFCAYLGWLTIGMLVVNEARSILENLVALGVTVPEILIRGLAIWQTSLEGKLPSEEHIE